MTCPYIWTNSETLSGIWASDKYKEGKTIKLWERPMWLWWLKHSKIWDAQTGDPGLLTVYFWSKSEGLRTRRTDGVSSSPKPKSGEDQCPSSKTIRWRRTPSYLAINSIQAFKELNETHQHWGKQSALCKLWIHMLISFKKPS